MTIVLQEPRLTPFNGILHAADRTSTRTTMVPTITSVTYRKRPIMPLWWYEGAASRMVPGQCANGTGALAPETFGACGGHGAAVRLGISRGCPRPGRRSGRVTAR